MAIGDHTPRTYKPGDMAYVRLALTDPAGIDRTLVELSQVGGGGGFALSSPNTLYKETAREVIVSGAISKTVPPGDYETAEAVTRDRLGNRSVRTLSPPLKITVEEGLQDTEGPDVSGWGFTSQPFLEAPRSATTASVKDYGAKGDGVTDDSPAFQAAIDAVFNDGGGTVSAGGRYRLGAPITVKSNVHLVGVARAVNEAVYSPSAPWNSLAVPYASLRTSVLLIDHGAGTSVERGTMGNPDPNPPPAIKLEGNSPAIVGFTIEYPNQVDPSTASVPAAYPPTIGLGTLSTNRVQVPAVRDVFIANAYDGICFEIPHNRAIIEHVRLGAYRHAMCVDGAYGVTRIGRVHIMPYYLLSRGIPYAEHGTANRVAISDWSEGTPTTVGNGKGLLLGKCDWAEIHDFFAFSRAIGIQLSNFGQGVSSGKMFGVGLDAVDRAIYAAATKSRGWDIYGLHSYIYDLNQRITITTAGTETDPPKLRMFGGSLGGHANTVRHANHQEGSLTLDGVEFSATTFGTIRYSADANYMRVHGCRWLGGTMAPIAYDAGATGKVIVAENDIGGATPAVVPGTLTNYRAGGNFGLASSGW